MPIIAKKKKIEYTPAPEGLHPAVCCDVVDLGLQDTPWGQKEKVEIRWQIEESNPDNGGKPFDVRKRFTLSLHEKANLRITLETWRGRKFSDEELEGFDLEKLLGVPCQVQVIHNAGEEGRVYANVQAVVPAGKKDVKLRIRDYVRQVDRERSKELEKEEFSSRGSQIGDEDIPF
jgi:hypothetical protein